MTSILPQRQCVFLMGEPSQWLPTLTNIVAEAQTEALVIGDVQLKGIQPLTHKQALRELGKEFSLIIYDATEQVHPDSFGAISGTLTAGGLMIVLLKQANSRYQQRFQRIAKQTCEQSQDFHWCESVDDLAKMPQLIFTQHNYKQTAGQRLAIAAIQKVVTGHRKRPLVLTSDRGRGKTAALGLAAAQLLSQGKSRILVTAPSLATVDTLFKHAQQTLTEAEYTKGLLNLGESEIRFIAPDKLIDTLPNADLVIIDEAAAIPNFMLEKLLQHYSRLVFATTLHGYEGTGRGFALRFQQTLQTQMPEWRSLTMTTPIRWAESDQLEPFSFDALLLDAEPVADKLVQQATTENVEFEKLNQAELSQNDQQLRELFGLMALAHYRTRPNDLQMLLDADDVSIYTLRYNGHIVASAWLIEEGGLDADLAEAIYNGNRRPNGDLLPQSLLAHSGIETAGQYRYQRIARIAVHPKLQRNGLGRFFTTTLTEKLADKTDCLGASFAESDDLLSFWLEANFDVVRLGLQQDDVSGSHAVMVVKPCSKQGQLLVEQTQQRLQQQWPFLLHTSYRQVKPELLLEISLALPNDSVELTAEQLREVNAFALEQRQYEVCQFSLWRWALWAIQQMEFQQLSQQHRMLIMQLLLQQREITDVVSWLGFSGRKQLIVELRQAVSHLI